jgi:hypothetical protein
MAGCHVSREHREPALVDGRAGCHAQHQQTVFAKRKWQDAMRIAGTLCFLGTVRSLPLISQARLPWRGRRGSFEQ